VAARKGSRMVKTILRGGQWSAMEKELHAKFKAVRALGKPLGQRWLLREGKKIFQQLYPDQVHVDENGRKTYKCLFSPGWFAGFQRRWHISWRIRTKVSQTAIQRFLQEVRRKSRPIDPDMPYQPRFQPCYIYNMDQTPIPFEFLQTRGLNDKQR